MDKAEFDSQLNCRNGGRDWDREEIYTLAGYCAHVLQFKQIKSNNCSSENEQTRLMWCLNLLLYGDATVTCTFTWIENNAANICKIISQMSKDLYEIYWLVVASLV